MKISVACHSAFGQLSEVKEAVRIINQRQDAFRLSVIKADWMPEFGFGNRSVDSIYVAKAKKNELGDSPSVLITRRPLRGGYFSRYRPNFYLISTSAWEASYPNRPLQLYLAYLIAGILPYFPIRLSKKKSDLQSERHADEPIGCVNDYCNLIDDIWNSLLRADICHECRDELVTFGVQDNDLNSVKPILASLRDLARLYDKRIPTDVFICHSSMDKGFARRLALDIHKEGFKSWFDEFQMKPGDSLNNKIQQGIRRSALFL
jgi:hypothetical protein